MRWDGMPPHAASPPVVLQCMLPVIPAKYMQCYSNSEEDGAIAVQGETSRVKAEIAPLPLPIASTNRA